MGQKVNPHGLRVGVIKDWDSKWYAEADFADNLVEEVDSAACCCHPLPLPYIQYKINEWQQERPLCYTHLQTQDLAVISRPYPTEYKSYQIEYTPCNRRQYQY